VVNKAVFLDRDNTIIQDPGYLSDPAAVKLLPGVELAIKSLRQAGYKIVVVTNQSGIARGLLTQEALERIHTEMQRQLAEKSAHLDAIYYCPYHPEGTVEAYAVESDLRKPRPGMLLKAAHELDIDLPSSWMVGDGPRDIEAGQRAGCRTIRVRLPDRQPLPGEQEDEDVEADFTLRNLVEAARVILREDKRQPGAIRREAAAAPLAEAETSAAPQTGEPATSPTQEAPQIAPPTAEAQAQAASERQAPSDREIQLEMLRLLQELAGRTRPGEFSIARLVASVAQALSILTLVAAMANRILGASVSDTIVWVLVAIVLQVMAVTFWVIRRNP